MKLIDIIDYKVEQSLKNFKVPRYLILGYRQYAELRETFDRYNQRITALNELLTAAGLLKIIVIPDEAILIGEDV